MSLCAGTSNMTDPKLPSGARARGRRRLQTCVLDEKWPKNPVAVGIIPMTISITQKNPYHGCSITINLGVYIP